MKPVLAAYAWPTNSDLIADVARLGYLRKGWVTLDPTYGKGNWWKRFRPATLVAHDIRQDGVDFRKLPHEDGSFDAVAFDPPYMSSGGRKTSTLNDFNDRFGVHTTPKSPKKNQQMIDDGLTEILRVLKPRGICLVKCMDYVSGGKLFEGTFFTQTHAHELGFEVIDEFEHLGKPSPQPKRTRKDGKPSVQQHAARNLSTLFVLRAPKVHPGLTPQLDGF